MSRGMTALRLTVVTLGLCAATGRGLLADAIDTTVEEPVTEKMLYTTMTETEKTPVSPLRASLTYTTAGAIGTTGITGQNIISFVPELNGSFTTPSAFGLGTFVVGYLPPGTTTTYNRTPFTITYTTTKVNEESVGVNETPVTITGFLNGSITGASTSSVVATFSPIEDPQFITGDYLNHLSVLDPQVSLVPSTTNTGRSTTQGHIRVTAAPIPEPTTAAIFLAAIAGLGVRHYRRRAA